MVLTQRPDKAVDLHVHSSDTVDILKMKILQAMNVAPHEQDLYYEDKLIESDALTLAQVGILPGYVRTCCKPMTFVASAHSFHSTTVKLVRVERDVPSTLRRHSSSSGSVLLTFTLQSRRR